MLPAFLTALFFAASISFAGRSAKMLGTTRALLWRCFVALATLGVIAHGWGYGLQGPGFIYFFLSGVVGLGVGDWCAFQGIRLIGPRLTILLVQCLCAPIAAAIEWLWLGTKLTPAQMGGGALILAGAALSLVPRREDAPAPKEANRPGEEGGVAVAVAPAATQTLSRKVVVLGTLGALGGAVCQAMGAVISRKAFEVNEGILAIDGLTAAYQRMCGVFPIVVLTFLVMRWQGQVQPLAQGVLGKAFPWLTANALSGMVFGVGCFQWALHSSPSALVLAVVALSPLLAVPFTYFINKDRPSILSLIGGVIAVAGVLVLRLL